MTKREKKIVQNLLETAFHLNVDAHCGNRDINGLIDYLDEKGFDVDDYTFRFLIAGIRGHFRAVRKGAERLESNACNGMCRGIVPDAITLEMQLLREKFAKVLTE